MNLHEPATKSLLPSTDPDHSHRVKAHTLLEKEHKTCTTNNNSPTTAITIWHPVWPLGRRYKAEPFYLHLGQPMHLSSEMYGEAE